LGYYTGIGTESQSDLAATGAYMLTKRFFRTELVKLQSGEYGLPQTMLAMAKEGAPVMVMLTDFWVPLGYPEDVKNAEAILSEIKP
jgi:NDP-sugar pyrophosphorylase family protein